MQPLPLKMPHLNSSQAMTSWSIRLVSESLSCIVTGSHFLSPIELSTTRIDIFDQHKLLIHLQRS